MTEGDKYPPEIQKLFAPKLPFLYKEPIGYYPEERRTASITPLQERKALIARYKEQYAKKQPSGLLQAQALPETLRQSKERQLREWQDTEGFNQNKFLKNPYCTVFVARLHYSATELDVSKTFTHYGSIESVRVARDKETGQSRGYAFVVFEDEADAKRCIRELAPTGVVVKTDSQASRRVLVDMERGRLVRNWLPRRLGGGLGGRHYSQPSTSHLHAASAAASGRRPNLSSNPYQQANRAPRMQKRPGTDRSGPNKRHASEDAHWDSAPVSGHGNYYKAPEVLSYTPAASTHSVQSVRGADTSVRNRYAKYQNMGDSRSANGNERRR